MPPSQADEEGERKSVTLEELEMFAAEGVEDILPHAHTFIPLLWMFG